MWELQQNSSTGEPEYVFSGFENGIGDSPYTGISYMSGLNIKNYPKIGYSNLKRTNSTTTGGAPTEQINYTVQDPAFPNNLYSLSSKGVVRQSLDAGITWTIVTGNTTTDAYGNGMFIYAGNNAITNWLHICRDEYIDVIAIDTTGTTGSWTNGAMSWSNVPFTGVNHSALVGRDLIPYICNGQYISSITYSGTYNPATATLNQQALTLPTIYGGFATSLAELRTYLLITIGNLIVPWDRTSTSYDIPFPFPEFVSKMVNVNNTIYCFGGVATYFNHISGDNYNGSFTTSGDYYNPVISGRGNVYYYNGFSGDFFKKIPDSIAFTTSTSLPEPQWLIGGTMSYLNKIYFGTLNNGGYTGGIFSLDVSTQSQAIQYQVAPAPLNIENSSSDFYTALCPTINTLVNSNILSFSGARTKISSGYYYYYDYTNQAGLRETGEIFTDMLQVGMNQQKKTFNTIEIRFLYPLLAGETVQVYGSKYFNGTNTGSDFVPFTYTASGNTDISFTCPTIVQKNEELGLFIITTPTAYSFGVPIKNVIIR